MTKTVPAVEGELSFYLSIDWFPVAENSEPEPSGHQLG